LAFFSGLTVKIFEFLKIQDGGGRHLENHKNRDIFEMVWPIFTKLGTVVQNCALSQLYICTNEHVQRNCSMINIDSTNATMGVQQSLTFLIHATFSTTYPNVIFPFQCYLIQMMHTE